MSKTITISERPIGFDKKGNPIWVITTKGKGSKQ